MLVPLCYPAKDGDSDFAPESWSRKTTTGSSCRGVVIQLTFSRQTHPQHARSSSRSPFREVPFRGGIPASTPVRRFLLRILPLYLGSCGNLVEFARSQFAPLVRWLALNMFANVSHNTASNPCYQRWYSTPGLFLAYFLEPQEMVSSCPHIVSSPNR
jgi:hypothetical protein